MGTAVDIYLRPGSAQSLDVPGLNHGFLLGAFAHMPNCLGPAPAHSEQG